VADRNDCVMPSLGDIRCMRSQVIEVAPETVLKVTVDLRSFRVVGESEQFHIEVDTVGRWRFTR